MNMKMVMIVVLKMNIYSRRVTGFSLEQVSIGSYVL